MTILCQILTFLPRQAFALLCEFLEAAFELFMLAAGFIINLHNSRNRR